jgi:hypothetical protein
MEGEREGGTPLSPSLFWLFGLILCLRGSHRAISGSVRPGQVEVKLQSLILCANAHVMMMRGRRFGRGWIRNLRFERGICTRPYRTFGLPGPWTIFADELQRSGPCCREARHAENTAGVASVPPGTKSSTAVHWNQCRLPSKRTKLISEQLSPAAPHPSRINTTTMRTTRTLRPTATARASRTDNTATRRGLGSGYT